MRRDTPLSRYAPHNSSCDISSESLDIVESERDGYIAIIDHQATIDSSDDLRGWRVLRTGIGSLSQAERIVIGIERNRRREREIADGDFDFGFELVD